MRHWFPAMTAAAVLAATTAAAVLAATAPAAATSPLLANGDYPYWKLDYARYDTTYAAIARKAERQASFEWDATTYCRYRTGWEGPGAYKIGDRFRTRYGWDAGYPWQGPGVLADHEDAEALAEARIDYRSRFGRAPVCGPVRHHRRHEVVLRRKG